jgi:imidazolonepropionase-like amidohydrolase
VEELRLLMTSGLSLPEGVHCAALNGARLLNLKALGLLAEGMHATFIATRGDPSNLPESLNSIERILIRGRFYAPEFKT